MCISVGAFGMKNLKPLCYSIYPQLGKRLHTGLRYTKTKCKNHDRIFQNIIWTKKYFLKDGTISNKQTVACDWCTNNSNINSMQQSQTNKCSNIVMEVCHKQ